MYKIQLDIDPLAKIRNQVAQIKQEKKSLKPLIKLLHKSRLLLIESNAKDRFLTKAQIAELNLEIFEAIDNKKALEIAANTPLNLILINVSSYEDLKTISQLHTILNPSKTSIISCSYQKSQFLYNQCFKRGADLFLLKPIERDFLLFNLHFILEFNSL